MHQCQKPSIRAIQYVSSAPVSYCAKGHHESGRCAQSAHAFWTTTYYLMELAGETPSSCDLSLDLQPHTTIVICLAEAQDKKSNNRSMLGEVGVQTATGFRFSLYRIHHTPGPFTSLLPHHTDRINNGRGRPN